MEVCQKRPVAISQRNPGGSSKAFTLAEDEMK